MMCFDEMKNEIIDMIKRYLAGSGIDGQKAKDLVQSVVAELFADYIRDKKLSIHGDYKLMQGIIDETRQQTWFACIRKRHNNKEIIIGA